MISPQINKIIAEVIKAEGGYSNNANDRGGETMYGITIAVARANGYKGSMRDMPKSVAEAIYMKRYVVEPRFDKVAEINEAVALEVIDTGVNMGPARAAEFLQRMLNMFNLKNSGYQDLFVDGRLGPLTFDALKRYLAKRKQEGELVLLTALNSIQGHRYIAITEADPSQREFAYGWFRERVRIRQ